jgi:cbb3-type cytochrome oxidase subunit 3
MRSQAFANFTITILPTIGLFIFLLIFICACLWVFRKDSKEYYKKLSSIPFKKDVL